MSSLQHLCRLTVFKVLRQRRDLIPALPLPARLHEYLDTPTYLIEDDLVDVSFSFIVSYCILIEDINATYCNRCAKSDFNPCVQITKWSFYMFFKLA